MFGFFYVLTNNQVVLHLYFYVVVEHRTLHVHKDKDKGKDVFIGPEGICFTHDDDTNKRQAIPPIEIDL